MSLSFRDGISPALARQAARIRDRRPILEAMGLEFVSLTKRAFSDAALRPSPWAPLKEETILRKKGRGGLLRDSGALWQSIRIAEVTNAAVTVASDRPYAAIHQMGGKTGRNHAATMPARPFFPVLNGHVTPAAQRKIEAVGQAKINVLIK